MKLLMTIFSCMIVGTTFAVLPNSCLLTNYKNKVFVETGTHLGDGVSKANQAGFETIHSIELFHKAYQIVKNKFANQKHIHLHEGDSGKILWEVIKDIDQPITFWLDSHFSGEGTSFNNTKNPILQELDQIKRHKIHTHTILIDDVRLFGTKEFEGITISQVKQKLLEINPNYSISFVDGQVANDILVAQICNKASQ